MKDILVRALGFSLCLLACACSGDDSRWPAEAAGDDVAPGILQRVEQRWFDATGLVLDRGAPIIVVDADLMNSQKPGANGITFINKGERDVHAIWVLAGLSDEDTYKVLTHEYGHALLSHMGSWGTAESDHHAIPGIMNSWHSGALTAELLEFVCDYNPCTRFNPESSDETVKQAAEDVRHSAAERGSP